MTKLLDDLISFPFNLLFNYISKVDNLKKKPVGYVFSFFYFNVTEFYWENQNLNEKSIESVCEAVVGVIDWYGKRTSILQDVAISVKKMSVFVVLHRWGTGTLLERGQPGIIIAVETSWW